MMVVAQVFNPQNSTEQRRLAQRKLALRRLAKLPVLRLAVVQGAHLSDQGMPVAAKFLQNEFPSQLDPRPSLEER